MSAPTIPETEVLPASFRDPSGFLFQLEGQLYRQINRSYQSDYDLLMSSGFYKRLVDDSLMIPHHEVDIASHSPELAYKVIQPERVRFISYPYEWSFSQLKDAALATLLIQKRALQTGMVLKDASAYNIQFHNGKPLLIDTLSFLRYEEGRPWVAYRQFCQHFLAPLALMSLVDVRLGALLRLHIDGIPLDLASRLLPRSTRFSFGLMTHIHLHTMAQQRYTSTESANKGRQARISRQSLIGLVESLESTVKKLTYKLRGAQWVDYYQATNYTDQAFEAKKQIVSRLLQVLQPKTVLDLGANTGVFSRLGVNIPGSLILATDIDPEAVEVGYQEVKKVGERNVLPLILDLTNPTPALGWGNQERTSFFHRGPADVVMALALIHHLAIANNVPLENISRTFAGLGRYLIIEFVPKVDSQVQRLLASRDDIFPAYTLEGFRAGFERDWKQVEQIPVPGTVRVIFLLERKQDPDRLRIV